MAKKDLTLTLLAAHTAALEKTMQSVEIQVAATKTALKLLNEYLTATAVTPNEDDDNEETEEKPAKKKPAKAAKKKVVEEDESEEDESEGTDDDDSDSDENDSASEDADEDESEDDDSEDEEEPAIKKQTVIKALQAFAAANGDKGKSKAIKIMEKVTGESVVHEVSPKKYAALLKALK